MASQSKFSKVAQQLGEIAYTRSPILGQMMEVASIFKRPDSSVNPNQSRLRNAVAFTKDMAIQRSPILQQMAMFSDFVKYVFEDDSEPDHTKSRISANPHDIHADGTSSSRIQVTLKNEKGIQLKEGGDHVFLTTTVGNLSTVADIGKGQYVSTLTSNVAGNAVVTAYLGPNNTSPVIGRVSVRITDQSSPSDSPSGSPAGSSPSVSESPTVYPPPAPGSPAVSESPTVYPPPAPGSPGPSSQTVSNVTTSPPPQPPNQQPQGAASRMIQLPREGSNLRAARSMSGGITRAIKNVFNSQQQNKEQVGASVTDYFEAADNKYFVSLKSSETHLEKIVGLLEKQVDMMAKTFDIKEEDDERTRESSRLNTVDRGGVNVPRVMGTVGGIRPDMGQISEEDPQAKEKNWLEWLGENLDEILAGKIAYDTLRGGWKKLGGLKGVVGKGLKYVPSVSKISKLAFAAKKIVPKAAPWVSKGLAAAGISKAAPWISKLTSSGTVKGVLKLAPKILGPAAVASTVYDGYAAAKGVIDESEALREQYPELRGLNFGLVQEKYLVERPELLAQAVEEAKRNGSFQRNIKAWETRKQENLSRTAPVGSSTLDIEPSIVSPTIKEPSGSGDIIKYLDSLKNSAAPSTKTNLGIIGETNTNYNSSPLNSPQPSPPIIVGPPTNVTNNHGGNVTNIYHSKDSLTPPTVIFNLPHGVQ